MFTQESGPFIYSAITIGVPERVFLDKEGFFVDSVGGICKKEDLTDAFKCNVEILADFSRITVFLPEIKNFSEIYIGYRSEGAPGGTYWITIKRRRLASLESVLEEEEGQESVIKFNVTQGAKPIMFFTCIYLDENPFDHITYRYIWPGVDAFLGEDKVAHSSSDIVQLQWIVRSWGPHEYRGREINTMENTLDGKTYQISGELDVCEDNAGVIGKLKTTQVTLLKTATRFHRQDYTLLAALKRILLEGPKPICG
ncbi:unnamed protein product [Dibothriocephalus latus]|uniref:Uncharacterized protein n=1 Tax=Dibothriocephalus latus TaxID=60516 RepID=A0A3P7LS53_DIBLA|nr:unnamed protein product [Dibothriocephalus latus]